MPLQTRSHLLKCCQMAALRFGAPDCPGSPEEGPAPKRSALLRAAKRRGGRFLSTHLGNPGWHYSGRWSGLGIFGGDAVDLPGWKAGTAPIHHLASFASAPCPTPCRGTIAGGSSP